MFDLDPLEDLNIAAQAVIVGVILVVAMIAVAAAIVASIWAF